MLYVPLPRRFKAAFFEFCQHWPKIAWLLGFAERRRRPLKAFFFLTLHIIGFLYSIAAINYSRTPQGSVAWALSLNTVPLVAVPAYMIFGETEFDQYVRTQGDGLREMRPMAKEWLANVAEAQPPSDETSSTLRTMANISYLPVTTGNEVELLVDGKDTYQSIFEAIDDAKDYILLQFYTIRADDVGNDLKARLIKKAKEGVRVYVLYDDVGSIDLTDDFSRDLREAGALATLFMRSAGKPSRFRLNYRNHRKLVVVDGRTAFVGGHNIGNEYLGKDPVLTPWRDSHLRMRGPIVSTLQVPFIEDWKWATDDTIEDLNWDLENVKEGSSANAQAVAVPTGPADSEETCGLFFHAAINAAQKRLWIATPYFVPDNGLIAALQLAAKRGVDVRILIPKNSDSRLTERSAYSYLDELDMDGIRFMRYDSGFMHQKVILVDDDFTAIGSANFDYRSVRLNFELMVGVTDAALAKDVEKMLLKDFSKSSPFKPEHLAAKSYWFRTSVRVARLLAPIQ